jgi:lipoprotein-anchoring transpeptidase ErfK/SrfK
MFISQPILAEAGTRASLPTNIDPPGEKLILVSPRIHAWGAYTADGYLVRSGVASTGKSWCKDINRPCRTKTGTYRIYYLGDADCYSTRFPIPTGGAPMPYCMYFNGNQALHGSYEVGYAHLSHGCVRMEVSDARWLRYNFVEEPSWNNSYRGTRVEIMPY